MKRAIAGKTGLIGVVGLMIMLIGLGASSCKDTQSMLINVDSTALHVGIAGEVRKSPMMPVARPGVEDSAPLEGATITIQKDGGSMVGKVISDSAGHFYVELEPGAYLLTAEPFGTNMLPRPPAPQQVVVPQNGIVQIQLDYDTGIR